MDHFEKIEKELEKFGLSKNQALIYLSLVQRGSFSIQDIANVTRIPRSSVYESLKTLFKLGLVEETIGQRSARIKPHRIGALRHVFNEKLLHFQTLITDLGRLETAIQSFSRADPPPPTA